MFQAQGSNPIDKRSNFFSGNAQVKLNISLGREWCLVNQPPLREGRTGFVLCAFLCLRAWHGTSYLLDSILKAVLTSFSFQLVITFWATFSEVLFISLSFNCLR